MRQASIDAYRGIVMFLMLAEVLRLETLTEVYPESTIADWLHFHTTHVPWVGGSLHDMIQPSFSFLVGVSLPFSIAARLHRGGSFGAMAWHAAWRSLLLVFLGIALRSLGRPSTYFFFVDTLTQIGLGYFLLFLLAHAARSVQIAAVGLILAGYWALFAFAPLPPESFDLTTVGVPADWPHNLSGFAAHWNKNAHPAFTFDQWFVNLFPQEKPFLNGGGYMTLNFIPTLATMLLGTLAGGVLKSGNSIAKNTAALLLPGVLMLVIGWALGAFGLCPVVKRIWTPSWVLYSGGICYLILGGLYLLCDVAAWRAWAWPFLVIGSNSIVAYVMSWIMEAPIQAFLRRHLGEGPFTCAGENWEPVLMGSAVLLVMWLILLWLYRQRIFVRI
jgi:heparan-alpha-glucosaminide N-acetyltransferase